jgi:hypothetical protein
MLLGLEVLLKSKNQRMLNDLHDGRFVSKLAQKYAINSKASGSSLNVAISFNAYSLC